MDIERKVLSRFNRFLYGIGLLTTFVGFSKMGESREVFNIGWGMLILAGGIDLWMGRRGAGEKRFLIFLWLSLFLTYVFYCLGNTLIRRWFWLIMVLLFLISLVYAWGSILEYTKKIKGKT